MTGVIVDMLSVTSTYKEVQNVKLYKVSLLAGFAGTLFLPRLFQQRCRELSGRCLRLMVALQESSRGLEGTRTIEVADEMEM